jgi:hypothetical protein
MRPVDLIGERVLFSPNISIEVNTLLQAAVAASSHDQSKAEKLFLQAQTLDSRCLQTYFALYKFYFFQKRLVDAGRIVLAGLEESAKQSGFPNDCQLLIQDKQKWNLYANEGTLFYLYTLKALAFIKLRLGYSQDAQPILSYLQQLDPDDLSGASVIMALAAGVKE